MATEPKTISYDDYLRLVGLLTLARDHNRVLRDIEKSAAAIVGVEQESTGLWPYYGHLSDAISQDDDANELLDRLEIAVPREPAR